MLVLFTQSAYWAINSILLVLDHIPKIEKLSNFLLWGGGGLFEKYFFLGDLQ